jgi:hypothetical protein
LWHANSEDDQFGVSQIILIGDAPAKNRNQILDYRKSYSGEEYWRKTPFKEVTTWEEEVRKLKAKNIPVHCFYLHDGAKENFKQISTETGGKFESLNIDSMEGSNVLTDAVTKQILSSVGQARGKGEDLANAYRTKYNKAYK